MIFACVNVRFKKGIPNVNFGETPTYHEMDSKVVAPKKPLKPGETVLIRTIGAPLVKLIVDRVKESPGVLGGPICGKVNFFNPAEDATPWADKELGYKEV